MIDKNKKKKKRPGRYIDFEKNGKIEQVYVFDDDLTRYVLKFDMSTNKIVLSYYDSGDLLSDVRPIRKIIKQTYEGSSAHTAFTKVLNNYELKMVEDIFEYDPQRHYVITDPRVHKDLTDIANNIKIPKDFRDFFFHVFGGSKVLRINTVVTQADIDRLGLDTVTMNTYLATLKDFSVIDEEAGWR
jgi:hypothetical protein